MDGFRFRFCTFALWYNKPSPLRCEKFICRGQYISTQDRVAGHADTRRETETSPITHSLIILRLPYIVTHMMMMMNKRQQHHEGVHTAVFLLVSYYVFGFLHECSHLVTSWLLGQWTPPNDAQSLATILAQALVGRACHVGGLREDSAFHLVVRHAGWMTSLLVACIVQCCCCAITTTKPANEKSTAGMISALVASCCYVSAWTTFVEAFCSDFLQIGGIADARGFFFCGNFGLVLINSAAWSDLDGGRKALDMLERLVHITMMRGAQSGGVLSWWDQQRNSNKLVGIRSRVVNGKRTDLSKGVRKRVLRDSFRYGKLKPGIQTFLGHTRFATSSKATFDGTHPHQWTPPQKRRIYRFDDPKVLKSTNPTPEAGILVENYITHNGDFDFYTINGVQYDLSTIQAWLPLATGAPIPSSVDSVAIAGMLDLLRTAGCFGLSIRYTMLLNCQSSGMDPFAKVIPSYDDFEDLGLVFEQALVKTCQQENVALEKIMSSMPLRQKLERVAIEQVGSQYLTRPSRIGAMISSHDAERGTSIGGSVGLRELVTGTIGAFFDNDLFQATRIFMANAKGSFGLMTTSSLDAHRQICLSARGQPISLALFPQKGLVVYGSELAAVKVALGVETPGGDIPKGKAATMSLREIVDYEHIVQLENSCRLDLDDLGGEVVLLDWRSGPLAKDVEVLLHQESNTTHIPLGSRVVYLEGNEYIRALPDDSPDPVLNDIRDIPRICQAIQDNWKSPDMNRFSAWSLMQKIKRRLNDRIQGRVPTHCNSVDILLTGCETSLWLAEQFATDLRKALSHD